MNINRAKILSLIVSCCVLSATFGCRSIVRTALKDSNSSQSNSQFTGLAGNKAAAADPFLEKTDVYIKTCVNNYSERVLDSYERYGSWMKDVEAGPTGKETTVYGLYEPSGDGQDCVDAINKVKASEPDMPEVEANADQYAAALKTVVARIKEIYPYYDREDYKDDSFKRGKEFHPTLLAAFKEFEGANKAFMADIDKLEDTVAQNQLKEYEGKPENRFEYLVTESSIKSKRILNPITRTDFAEIDAATLQPLIEDFEKTINELKALPADSENAIRKMRGTTYISAAEEFLKSSKELMRRIRDKKPFTEMEIRMGEMTDGTPQNVVRKYNDMINRQNSIR